MGKRTALLLVFCFLPYGTCLYEVGLKISAIDLKRFELDSSCQ